MTSDTPVQHDKHQHLQHPVHPKHGVDEQHSSLFIEVYEWLQREKAKRKAQNNKRGAPAVPSEGGAGDDGEGPPLERTASQTSEGGASLDKLEGILQQYAEKRHQPHVGMRRRTTGRGLQRGSFSESENTELESTAPAVDTFLDNTKTLGHNGGSAPVDADDNGKNEGVRQAKANWLTFKTDILRIIHTLRLKGWRRVPMEDIAGVGVERLSGALTNAVYVVSPPPKPTSSSANTSTSSFAPKRPPP